MGDTLEDIDSNEKAEGEEMILVVQESLILIK
jgi:hypothetical protein